MKNPIRTRTEELNAEFEDVKAERESYIKEKEIKEIEVIKKKKQEMIKKVQWNIDYHEEQLEDFKQRMKVLKGLENIIYKK